jgi:putative membrane protein
LLLRGSILQRIRWTLLFNTLLATAVTLAHGNLFTFKITLTPIPFTLMGLPLAIFLGFRNTTAYDRYWEGRKLWGELVLRTRNLSRQCLSLIELDQPVDPTNRAGDVRVRMVHRRLRMRAPQSDDALLQRWLPAQDWPRVAQSSVRPEAIMQGLRQTPPPYPASAQKPRPSGAACRQTPLPAA